MGTGLDFERFFTALAGNFAQHIDQSIPGYAENRSASAQTIIRRLPVGGKVLDVGASEGQFGNLLSLGSEGKVRTLNVDPNPAMRDAWAAMEPAAGTSYETAAWVEGFQDDTNGLDIPAFDTNEKFDVIHMSMVRQFVTADALSWYSEAKRFLASGGLFIVNSKLSAAPGFWNERQWKRNERLKDAYKLKHFSQEEISTKAEETLVGMHSLMLTEKEELKALHGCFQYALRYWKSYNFAGFIASDDPLALLKFQQEYNHVTRDY